MRWSSFSYGGGGLELFIESKPHLRFMSYFPLRLLKTLPLGYLVEGRYILIEPIGLLVIGHLQHTTEKSLHLVVIPFFNALFSSIIAKLI